MEIYSTKGLIESDNWWNDITYPLSQGSYTANFHTKDQKGNIFINVFKEFNVVKQSPLPEGKIVFVSDRDGNNEIYIMNTDGSGQTRLTNTLAEEEWPCFSPDGSKISFMSNRDGNFEIYIMNTDGTEQTNLTNNPYNDSVPSFSPDGSKIVFESDRDGNGEIYIMNADGTKQTNLTNTLEWELGPYFSTDGSKIAFRSDRDASSGEYAFSPDYDVNWEIYIMNADGSGQTRLTNNQLFDWEPNLSPDNSLILFTSRLLDKSSVIYIMNVYSSGQKRLTGNVSEKLYELDPRFSPDGSKITFSSNRDGNSEIYIMNTDGSGQTRLTDNMANDREPCIFFSDSKVRAADKYEAFRSAGPYTPYYTTNIPTIINAIRTKPSVLGTNAILALLTMLPFTVSGRLFNIILSKNEDYFKRKIQKIPMYGFFSRLNQKIEKRLGKSLNRYSLFRRIMQIISIVIFYGLIYSLLDPKWEPFTTRGLVLFAEMAIAYGMLGFTDDFIKWRNLKKWGIYSGFGIQPKNLMVSISSVLASRLLALVPGMMFGEPVVLQVDKSALDIKKRDKLLKIPLITFIAIGSGLWLMTFATDYLQKLFISGTFHDVTGAVEGFFLIVFAVAVQNTFIQMLGFPGSYGQTMIKRNRWVWFIGALAVSFVFYLTLINPKRGLVEALQKRGVILFLSIAGFFMVVTFILWLIFYIRKKHKLD
jgi:TolB protein